MSAHATQMVNGMLGLLTLCPQEVAHLRKELLIAARHILGTDLKNRMLSINCFYIYINIFILQALDYPSTNEC